MAGFGFSTSDIIEFGKFTAKIISALKEEGGSKFEYQDAVHSCEAFTSVLSEIQRLELSNAPDPFRQQLEKHLIDSQEFVQQFRDMIARYEKSMGKASTRGFVRSAPRKVQWSLTAAKELDNFRQRLSVQLQLVQLEIQGSLLSMLDRHAHPSTSKHLSPPRANLISGAELQPLLPSSSRPPYRLESANYLNGIDDFVDLIYERLLTRTAPIPRTDRRVNTLPDNQSFDTELPSDHESSGCQDAQDTESTVTQQLPIEEDTSPRSLVPLRNPDDNSLVNDIDALLRSFDLGELSDQEKAYLRQRQSIPTTNPPNNHNGNLLENDTQDAERNANHDQPRRSHGSGQGSLHGPFLHRSSQSRVDALEVAARFLHAVEVLYKLSTSAMRAYNWNFRVYNYLGSRVPKVLSAPTELLVISRRLSQQAKLLHIAAESIQASISGSLQELGMRLLEEHYEVMGKLHGLLLLNHLDWGYFSRWFLLTIKQPKLRVIIEDIESLKKSILMLMQIHQTQISERNFHLLESSYA